jgi:hypothetical protein
VNGAFASSRLVSVLMAAGALVPSAAPAQSVIDVRPSVTVTELHDSNLFAAPTRQQADFITRLTPSLDSEYRTSTLSMRAHYFFDAERYVDAVELSRVDARQQAGVEMRYSATPRVSWRATAGVTRTWTPGELLVQTGVILPRGRATRLSAGSTLTRHLDQRTDGTLEYALTDDRIDGGVTVHSHSAALNAVRRLSARTSVRAGYRVEWYGFGPATLATTPSVMAQALEIGWTRAMTERLSVSVAGGPRLTGTRLAPDFSASIRSRHDRTTVSLGYQRTGTVVIGVAGPVALENVTGQVIWNAAHGLRFRATPGLFRSRADGFDADVLRIEVGAEWPIADTVSVDLTFDRSTQSGRLHAALPGGTIGRSMSSVRLVVRPPAARPR